MCAILLGLFIGGDDRWPPKSDKEIIVTLSEFHQRQFFDLTQSYDLAEYAVTPDMFGFINNW